MPADKQGVILDTGFGQSDQYVWVTSLVENKSDHGGQTVTVSFNVKDAKGEIVKTETQIESFTYAGQKLALGTQVDVGQGVKAASVDATLLVEDEGTFEADDSAKALGTAESKIGKDEYGATNAEFKIMNPTDRALKDLRIGIICKDTSGKINGGSSEFPDLVPPSGQILVSTNSLITSGPTKSCTAYIAPGY